MNHDTQDAPMTAQEQSDFHADPANQAPQAPPTRPTRPRRPRRARRRSRLSDPVPVRLPLDVLEEGRQRAQADDRSVSSWVRRAVEHELNRSA